MAAALIARDRTLTLPEAGTGGLVATVIDPPEGDVYPTRIGVATPSGAAAHPYRFGGDFRQVRVRAAVMTLDRLRRTLMTGAD